MVILSTLKEICSIESKGQEIMRYDEVFINYCRDMMSKKEFEIYMAFIDADEEDINRSLLREDPEKHIRDGEKKFIEGNQIIKNNCSFQN